MNIRFKAGLILFGAMMMASESFADCDSTTTEGGSRVIRSSTVAWVSTCWNGATAVVAKLSNGDRVLLGDLGANKDLTKVRMAMMNEAIATGLPIQWARPSGASAVNAAAANGFAPEWIVLGRSDCRELWK